MVRSSIFFSRVTVTIEIPLSRGMFALVDAADAEFVSQWKWFSLKTSPHHKAPHFYAMRNTPRGVGKRHLISMHRTILGAAKGFEVDHINGNTLDNRRANLRLATRSQNAANRHHFANKHGYLGVAQASCGKFLAQLQTGRRSYASFGYATVEEAAAAYDSLARRHFGEFARLNFPDIRPSEPPFSQENRR